MTAQKQKYYVGVAAALSAEHLYSGVDICEEYVVGRTQEGEGKRSRHRN